MVILFVAAVFCVFLPRVKASAEKADDAERTESFAAITIRVGGKTVRYVDEPITPSDFTVAEEIERRRINAPIKDKLTLIDGWISRGADYKTAISVCFPLLVREIDGLKDELYIPPVDATVAYRNGKFSVTEEKSGRALDEIKLYVNLYYTLKFSGGGEVNGSLAEVPPAVTKEMLREELYLRGEYATDYSKSGANRRHNVFLALSKFDGYTLAAGETLSFNGVVGPRTESNGFKTAKIIIDGKYTDGVGGGACQASTAVYNAALLSDLPCRANAHSICPSYCPAGLDAMISSVSDMTVANTTDKPIRISVSQSGGVARVRFFGAKPKETVRTESVIVRTDRCEVKEFTDVDRKYVGPNAVSGDRVLVSAGKDGVKSETYLNYYSGGKCVRRVKLRENEYKCVPDVIAVAP